MRNLGKKFIVAILLGVYLWVIGIAPLQAEIRWEEGATDHYLTSEEKYFYPHLKQITSEKVLSPVIVLSSQELTISSNTPALKRYAMAGLVGKLSEQSYPTFFPTLLNPVSNTANFQKARAEMPRFLSTFNIKTHSLAANFQAKDLQAGELYLAELKNTQEVEHYLSKMPKKVILLIVSKRTNDLVIEYNPYDRSGVFSSHSLRTIGLITPADLLNRFISYFKLPALPILADGMAYSNVYYTSEPVTVTLDTTNLKYAENDWQARLDFLSRINLNHNQYSHAIGLALAFVGIILIAIRYRKKTAIQLGLFLLFPAGMLAYNTTHYLGLAGIYTLLAMGFYLFLLWSLLLVCESYIRLIWQHTASFLTGAKLPPFSFLFALITLLAVCFYSYYENYSAPISFEKMIPFFESDKVFLTIFSLTAFITGLLLLRFLKYLNKEQRFCAYWKYLQGLNYLILVLTLGYALRDLLLLGLRDILKINIYALPISVGLPLSNSYSALAISLFYLSLLLGAILLPLYFSIRFIHQDDSLSRIGSYLTKKTTKSVSNRQLSVSEILVLALTVLLLGLGSWGHFAGPGFSASPHPVVEPKAKETAAKSTNSAADSAQDNSKNTKALPADSANPQADSTPVAVVMATDLDWKEITLHEGLSQLISTSSGFAFRSDMRLAQLPCPQDNWLVLSAGGSPWKYSIGGYMLCSKLGYSADSTATPLFNYYQDSASRIRYQSGLLGEQLKQHQITTAQIGKAAFLGAVQKDGSFYGDRFPKVDPNTLGKIVGSHQLTLIEANLKENDYTHTRQDYALNAYGKLLRDTLYNTKKPNAAPAEWDWRWPLYESGKLSYQNYILPQYYPYEGKWQGAEKLLAASKPEELPYPNPKLTSVHTSFDFLNSSQSPEEIYHFIKDNQRYLSTVKFDKDQDRNWFNRQVSDEQYQKMDHLYQILKHIPAGTRVMVVTTSNGKYLTVGFAYGPGIGSGLVYSPSLHHQGLAQSGDILATTLRWLNIDTKKLNLAGAKLDFPAPGEQATQSLSRLQNISKDSTVASNTSSNSGDSGEYSPAELPDWIYTLQNNSIRAEVVYQTGKDFYKGIAIFFSLISLLGLFLLALPVQRFLARLKAQTVALSLIRLLLLVLMALPVGGIFASEVSWWIFPGSAFFFQSFALSTAILIVICALGGPWKRHSWGTELFIMALTVIMFCLDLVAGSRIMQDSPIGFYTLYGGRYYGMGNESFAIVSVACICLIAALVYPAVKSAASLDSKARRRRKFVFNLLLFGLGGTFIILDGSPNLGADFGGPLAFLPALILLFLLINQIKISWKKFLLIGLVTFGFSSTLAVLDYLRPLEKRTHLGRLVQSVFDGELLPIILNKLSNNLKTLLYFSYVSTSLVCIIVLFVLISRLNSSGVCQALSLEKTPVKRGRGLTAALAVLPERLWGYLRAGLTATPLFQENPVLKPVIISVSCCATLAYLLNDSGTQLFGLSAYFFGSAILSYLYQQIQDNGIISELV